MFDYHVHSHFSADCREPLETIVQKAISTGMREICITDHMDYDYNDPTILFEFDVESHRQTFIEMKAKYAGRIDLKRGLELGIQPHVLEKSSELVREQGFDFVLASVHECEKKDFHLGDFFVGRSADESYRAYLVELESMLTSFDAFSVVGHIDIPKRYDEGVAALSVKPYLDSYERIFNTLIRAEKGIEINTSGLRQSVGRAFPDYELLGLYHELGGRILTLGSDSHTSDTLCYKFDEVGRMLKSIGFKCVYGFKAMEPYEIRI